MFTTRPSNQRMKAKPSRPCPIDFWVLPQNRKRYAYKRWNYKGAVVIEEAASSRTQSFDDSSLTKASLTEKELLHSINYLDEDGLLSFPGIGNYLAKVIVEHRNVVDYYTELEGLLEVPRFGAKRFENLVGRKPHSNKLKLRQLFRIDSASNQPITTADFCPWMRPASGIRELWLIHKSEYFSAKQSLLAKGHLIVERVGSYRLVFVCESENLKGRSNYIIRKLPKIIRSINYERAFTTTN